MVLRHLKRLLVKLKPKWKSKSKPKPTSQPAAQSGGTTQTHPLESIPAQAVDEPTPDPQPTTPNESTKEHPEPRLQSSPVRPDTRRYGQIFENSNRDRDTRASSELVRPDTEPLVSTTALYPPLPPFRERKRSCGGA